MPRAPLVLLRVGLREVGAVRDAGDVRGVGAGRVRRALRGVGALGGRRPEGRVVLGV